MLAHYENETKAHDSNDDGFADIPRVEQYNLWNRWAYMGDRYVIICTYVPDKPRSLICLAPVAASE